MTDKEPRSNKAAELRKQAEEIVRERSAQSPKHLEALSPEETRQTLHELRVHQIELEMQNEELRRAQVELDAGRARYFDLYDLAPVGYCTLSEQGLILEANLTAAGLLGVARGALVQQPITRFILKEDQDLYYLHRKQLFETGVPQACELRMVKKDGTQFWARLEAAAAQDADGAPVCRLIISDITEHKQAADALRFLAKCGAVKGEDFFQSLAHYLAQSLGMDYVCIDQLQEGLLAAQTVAVWFDGKFEDNVSYTLKDTPCGDVVEKTICCFPKGVRHLFPKDVVLQEMLAESYVGTILRSSQGQPIGLIAIIGRRPLADPTLATSILQLVALRAAGELERRQAEEALHQAHHRLTETLNSITDAFFSVNPSFVVTAVNPAAERILGKTRDELLGRNLWEQFPEAVDSGFHRQYVKALSEGTAAHFEEYYPPFDAWFEVHAYPSLVGLAVYFRDITERKQMEQERAQLLGAERAARMEAERANRAKDEFLAVVSHELRSPLGAILGWARLAKKNKAQDTGRALNIIERSALSLAQLIGDLLDMSRITSGKLRLKVQTVEPSQLIDAVVEEFQFAAEEKGVVLELAIQPDLLPIRCDPNRIEQVISNLLSNAIKFTPESGRIRVHMEQDSSRLTVRVTDSGKGISAAFLPHLFDKFQQADSSTTREHGGLGLGLAIVRQLVQMHGGTVQAESEGEGKGSTFTVTLPIASSTIADSDDRETNSADDDDDEAMLPDGLTVLLVDDESEVCDLIGRVFTESGACVLTAHSAHDAWTILLRDKPDVLVSDISMPGEDGYALIRRIRSTKTWCADMACIALTSLARPEDRQRALHAGFDEHLPKTVHPSELIRVVRREAWKSMRRRLDR